ncbi:MAG: hypothetical protein K2H98_09415 [Duncaniella sp.]|nr:hypothetical protein [Duncaniella sp.]
MKIKNIRVALNEPRKFIPVGNGYWNYNYLLKTEEEPLHNHSHNSAQTGQQAPDGQEISAVEPEMNTCYHYITISMFGRPSYARCVEAVIREHLSQSQEFDLINSYARAQFNLLADEDKAIEAAEEYVDYLNTVASIKARVRADFDVWEADRRTRLNLQSTDR